MKSTEQMDAWTGSFGEEYTRRNLMDLEAADQLYERTLGVSRTQLNEKFLGHLPRDARILEVGTNIGRQLGLLERMGFTQLYGVELQWRAIDVARQRFPRTNIVQGSALELPFRDGWFQLVFTSGVLIHIGPKDLPRAMQEMHRCSARYIFGHEYFADDFAEIPYRGESNLLWKGNYAQMFLKQFPDLTLVREERLPSKVESTVDTVYLLEKKS